MPEAEDIPQLARKCYDAWRSASEQNRLAGIESLKFWVGGELQWRTGELAARKANNRPFLTINRCKPAVDQVENQARNNPPGPQCHPVGGGADKDGADILEGIIREYEYRSFAHSAYITALRYAAAGNSGCFEMATEYCDDRSMEQQVTIKEIEDPATVFSDPNARKPCREDAMQSGKIRVLSREQLIEAYGDKLKVLDRNILARGVGWMQEAVKWQGDQASINAWTGGGRAEGPFYVCEFYRVVITPTKLTLYSDNILRFEGENIPAGITPKRDTDGSEITRQVPRRTVKKYVVTALDTLNETDWLGTTPPYFWVLGPEIYIDGKLHRLSLISGAMDSQRGLNYTATSAAEICGTMTKTPWIGWEGQFDTANAQGINPWVNTSQTYAYMEVKPVFATNEVDGSQHLLPAPQRNTWEAPIQRLMELATFFGEQIKAATSVFFDPTAQTAAQVQSGAAIKALQSQTNIGTINWQDQLHRAVTLSYQQAAIILPKIMDGPRVITIVRPDSQHETAEINREFPAAEMDHATGKRRNPQTGALESRKDITLGRYSLRVEAGASFETRQEQATENVTEFFRIAPQALAAPGVAGQFLRLLGEGNPQVEQMADMLTPGKPGEDQTPEQLQAQLMQAQQTAQQMQGVVQHLQQVIAAKLPEIQSKEKIAVIDALTKIRTAEITASKDLDRQKADIEADHLSDVLGFAHDAASQATDQEHQQSQAMQQQAAAQQSQAADQAHQQGMAQQAQEAQPAGDE